MKTARGRFGRTERRLPHTKRSSGAATRWPKTLGDFTFPEARILAFSNDFRPWPRSIVFGQVERIVLQRDLSGRLTCTSLLQGLPVVPRHPGRRIPGQFGGVVLQFGEVMEGIGLVQFASMDQAHVEIAHVGTVLGFINRLFLRCKMAFFKARSQILLSRGAPALRKNKVSGSQCFNR